MSEKDFNFDAITSFQVYLAQSRNWSSLWRSSLKICSWNFHKIHRKTLVPEPQPCKFIKKETLAQVFSREFCEIFKNIFIYRTPPDDCFWRCKIFFRFFSYGISPGDCFEYISSRKAIQKVFKKIPRKHPWTLKKVFF